MDFRVCRDFEVAWNISDCRRLGCLNTAVRLEISLVSAVESNVAFGCHGCIK
jgi:hypothetical protein